MRNQDRFQNKSTILSRISEGWAVRGRYADAAIGASRAAGQGLVGDAIQGPIEAAKGWNEGESIGAGHKEPFAAAPAGAGRRHSARHCRRVLVADGDAAGRSSLRQMLREWGFEVVTAKNGEEALSILEQERPPDLAILRQMLPGIDGLEVSRRASEIASENAPYVFLLAREGGKQEIVRALEAGAQECLAAPVEEQELRARLLAAERILMRRDRLIRSRDEFRRQATKDALTGVWNRRGIVEILEREMKRGERFERPTGILLMDLDHFKSVNDTHGHLSGDLVLQEASRRLSRMLRAYDSIGRYGGEEFLIVAPGTEEKELCELAERLRTGVECEPVRAGRAEIHITLSIGAAIPPPGDQRPSHAIAAADGALYKAKKTGRNRTVVHDSWFVERDSRFEIAGASA